MRKMLRLLGLVVCLFFVLAPLAIAQVDYCEGNFDYDRDQDGTDAFTFKADFGRSTLLDPCPADGPAPIPMTGQRLCYDSTGTLRNCVGTGEDGEYLSGVAWPNQRFTDHGDGTVTDNLTGLMWTKDTQQIPEATAWQDALDACNSLVYTEYDDWRLPNVRELQSLLDYGRQYPALPQGHPFINLSFWYWSSTTIHAKDLQYAWVVNIDDTFLLEGYKPGIGGYAWPVRGGRVLMPF